MNISNILTVLRILFIPFFLFFFFMEKTCGMPVALLVFILASLTDLYDGLLARKNNQVTEFGKLMDPVADKLLVISVLISFVQINIVPAWMIIVIIAREFIITSLRLVALSKGKIIAAAKTGKHKTIWQMVSIILVLITLSLKAYIPDILSDSFVLNFSYFLMLGAVVTSVFSALDFFLKNKESLF
ncbi:MAG: CDP-diacylglycerol--glycerol-3-phosphate 3-phosphatidyltransferase [Candidatus Firestonebacteria bacterium]